MMSNKIFSCFSAAVICSLLLMMVGCAPLGEEAAKPEVELEKQVPEAVTAEVATLALKFTPQDLTTYKVVTQVERSVEFKGPLADDPKLKGGRTGGKVEMTFTQQIQSVDGEGNAVAKITIKGLKQLSTVKNNTVLDFDSSREKDKNSPLAKLIGQSYTIKISPTSEVIEVIDVSQAGAAVRGNSTAHKAALALLKPDIIKGRHAILPLPVIDKNQLRTGDNWSSIETFSFGLMGSKSYERICTLKEIEDTDSRRIAIVEMNAIPTSETTEQLYKEQAMIDFSKMFDNTETYTGQLKLDLTAGKIEKYVEKLQSEWIAIDPEVEQKGDEEPRTLRMSATRLYGLEKID